MRRFKSNLASPLHMVRKKDGTWRPCGDYRQLNLVTKPDLYPPPHMEDLSTKLEGMKVFTTIDLRKGYWQIPVEAKDVEKTAVITPFGLWEFLRMPFWAEECWPDLPEVRGQHLGRHPPCICLQLHG